MLSERLQQRLRRDRPMTSITLRIPVDVVDSLKEIAPRKGLTGYQALLKAYVSEGLRRDEALLAPGRPEHLIREQLIEALKAQGVPQEQLDAALRQISEPEPPRPRPASANRPR
jgi:hypothetical protein